MLNEDLLYIEDIPKEPTSCHSELVAFHVMEVGILISWSPDTIWSENNLNLKVDHLQE